MTASCGCCTALATTTWDDLPVCDTCWLVAQEVAATTTEGQSAEFAAGITEGVRDIRKAWGEVAEAWNEMVEAFKQTFSGDGD